MPGADGSPRDPCRHRGGGNRRRIVLHGSPQLCTDCGYPIEFAPAWRWVKRGLQAALVIAFFAWLWWRPGPSLAGVVLFAALAAVQLGHWLLTPIVELTAHGVARRNRWDLIVASLFSAAAFAWLFYASR